MEFGPVPPTAAEGAVLAHSVALPRGRLRKGRVLDAADCAALAAAGIREVTVARLGPGDVPEDEAAGRLAAALEGQGIEARGAATGRVNLHAARRGVFAVGADGIDALNAVDPGITLATLAHAVPVDAGAMVGTVKIISYAVPEATLAAAEAAAHVAAMAVLAPVVRSASLIVTTLPGGPDDAKAIRAIGARVEALGADFPGATSVPHETAPLAEAIAAAEGEAVLILTASATSDVRDTAPAAVAMAGGTVERFGMPVDPGNLLFVGAHRGRPVIGLPGCARSPALNGADWIMARIFAGLPCGDAEIARMGVGGLLKEIPQRGRPRGGGPAPAARGD